MSRYALTIALTAALTVLVPPLAKAQQAGQQVAVVPATDTVEFNLLLRAGRLHTAQRLALGFKSPGPAIALAERLLARGSFAAAEQWFMRAERWGGGYAAISGQAQTALAVGDQARAQQHLARLPDRGVMTDQLIQQLTKSDFQQAIDAGHLSKAADLAQHVKSAPWAAQLGWSYLERNDLAYARLWFDRSLNWGDSDDARIGGAATALADGDTATARQFVDAVDGGDDRLTALRVRLDLSSAQDAIAAGDRPLADQYLSQAAARADVVGDAALRQVVANQSAIFALRQAQAAYDKEAFSAALAQLLSVNAEAEPGIHDAAALIAGWSHYRLGNYRAAEDALMPLRGTALGDQAAVALSRIQQAVASTESATVEQPIEIVSTSRQVVSDAEPDIARAETAQSDIGQSDINQLDNHQPQIEQSATIIQTALSIIKPAPIEPVTVAALPAHPVPTAAAEQRSPTTYPRTSINLNDLPILSEDERREGWLGRAVDWLVDAPQSALLLADDLVDEANPIRLWDLIVDNEPLDGVTAEAPQPLIIDVTQPTPPIADTGLSLGGDLAVIGDVFDGLITFDPPSLKPSVEPILPAHEGFGLLGAADRGERIGMSGVLEGAYPLNSDWDLVGFAGGTSASDFDEYVAGFSLRYSFGPTKRPASNEPPPVTLSFAPR
ncbi:MAG: hypothetical protein AAF556_05850 [Pseudomonadota bacterium]